MMMENFSAPAGFEARFAELRAKRKAAGSNVHFINERGKRDMMSMASVGRADALRANLRRNGREVL